MSGSGRFPPIPGTAMLAPLVSEPEARWETRLSRSEPLQSTSRKVSGSRERVRDEERTRVRRRLLRQETVGLICARPNQLRPSL